MPKLILIYLTFVAAMVLTLLPVPDWAVWIRPQWVTLVFIYWNMVLPHRVNVGIAWILGIILDVLHGTILGEHALALVFIAYMVDRMYSRLRMFSILQQALCMFLLIGVYQLIIYCIQGFIDQLPKGWAYWSSSLISMLLWPWIYIILRDYRRRFQLT